MHFYNRIQKLSGFIFSGLPWSVYGWFYSNVRGNDADTFISMDMQSFIISADLVSALLDNSMEELAKAADPPTFLGIFYWLFKIALILKSAFWIA